MLSGIVYNKCMFPCMIWHTVMFMWRHCNKTFPMTRRQSTAYIDKTSWTAGKCSVVYANKYAHSFLALCSLYHQIPTCWQCMIRVPVGRIWVKHYSDVIMGAMASQINSLTIVYSSVYSDADQRKHQSSASLAFVRGIHRWPVNSPHKWPVSRKMFPFDDVIMKWIVTNPQPNTSKRVPCA